VLWVGPTADADRVARVADRLGGELDRELNRELNHGADTGFLVLRKLAPTPPGFPRRPGMAKKRPLA
jgi:hypothetical protein